MTSLNSSSDSHCRLTDAQKKIQNVIQELTDRAEHNVLLREPLAALRKMLDEASKAEATCHSLSSTWLDHQYTYDERSAAKDFNLRMYKLIRLALRFTSQPLVHEPSEAIKLIRLKHDAGLAASRPSS